MWGSSTIQLVWFVQSADSLNAERVFEKLVGDEPVSVQKNKFPSPASPYFGLAVGGDSEVNIQVQLQPGRVDFLLQPSEDARAATDEIATLDTRLYLTRFITKVAEGSPIDQPVNRVAVVVNLSKPVQTLEAGIDLTMQVSGFTPSVRPDSEFLIQLNSRKNIAGTVVNRLVRYGVMGQHNVMFDLAVDPNLQPGMSASSVRYAMTTMLDFNTVPDGTWIDEAKQRTIFVGISDEMLRVAENGKLEALG